MAANPQQHEALRQNAVEAIYRKVCGWRKPSLMGSFIVYEVVLPDNHFCFFNWSHSLAQHSANSKPKGQILDLNSLRFPHRLLNCSFAPASLDGRISK